MTIGDNIKVIRKEKKLTQKQLADEMNISRSYLGDLENNRKSPSMNTVESLAEKLGVSMLYLTTGKKALVDLTDEEKIESIKGIGETFKKKNELLRIDIKEDITQLLNSELNFIQTIYLSNAINFLKLSNKEDIITLTSFLMTLNQQGTITEEDIPQADLLEIINETTKEFNDFLKARLHYSKEGE